MSNLFGKIGKNLSKIKREVSEVTTKYYRTKYYEKKYADLIEKAHIIIQPNEPDYGFFAHVVNICGNMKWAIEQGKKPYVDMSAFPNIYISDEQVGKVNSWELYFEQPFGFTSDELEEIMEYKKAKRLKSLGKERYLYKLNGKKKVIYLIHNYQTMKPLRPDDSSDFLDNEVAIRYWRDFVGKLIKPKEELLANTDALYKELFGTNRPENDKVLGVLLRGTDYSDNRPKNHPIPPTVEEALPRINDVFAKGNYTRIFLATEDIRILDEMKKVFGDVVFCAPQKRVGYTEGKILREIFADESDNNPYLRGFDFITAMLLLSRCDGFMGCRTSGAIMAFLMSKGFEDEFFWNIGRYRTAEYPDELILPDTI